MIWWKLQMQNIPELKLAGWCCKLADAAGADDRKLSKFDTSLSCVISLPCELKLMRVRGSAIMRESTSVMRRIIVACNCGRAWPTDTRLPSSRSGRASGPVSDQSPRKRNLRTGGIPLPVGGWFRVVTRRYLSIVRLTSIPCKCKMIQDDSR